MSVIEQIAMWVQILALPIAILSILFSVRSSARSQDTFIILNFIESFREKWEGGWSDVLDRLDTGDIETADPEDIKQLRYILNWIDWVGRLSEQKILRNKDVILSSIKPALQKAIRIAEPIIEADCQKTNSSDYWGGVHIVKNRLSKI